MTHSAAILQSKGASLELVEVETPKPGPSEVLIKVNVIAFSPIESKLQRFELHPLKYPNILGLSAAGVVESVGSDVHALSRGDNVVAFRPDSKLNDIRFGAFQQYVLASADSVSKLLPGTSLDAGAAVVVNLATVTAALSVFLGLDRPSLTNTAPKKGKKILVYGGSSSCGGLAIGYATAAGYDVVTTSSPKNRDLVTSFGPVAVIDHTQEPHQVVEDIRSQGPYFQVFDTIGVPAVTKIIADYLSSVGGGSYSTLIPDFGNTKKIPDNVQRNFESYGWIFEDPKHKDLKKWFSQELLPVGLASGIIIPTRSQWVRGGLKQVQHALDLLDRGEVSGAKLVLDPWE